MKILPSFLVTAFLVGTVSLAAAKPVRAPDEKPTKHERLVARFDAIDTDDDGMISRAEFIAHRKAGMDKRADRKDQKAKQPKKGHKKAAKKAKQLRRATKNAKAPKAG